MTVDPRKQRKFNPATVKAYTRSGHARLMGGAGSRDSVEGGLRLTTVGASIIVLFCRLRSPISPPSSFTY